MSEDDVRAMFAAKSAMIPVMLTPQNIDNHGRDDLWPVALESETRPVHTWPLPSISWN